MVAVLKRMIRERDLRLYRHSLRVSRLSIEIAKKLNKESTNPSVCIELVGWAGLLHDIGKLYTEKRDVWDKKSHLSDDEKTVVESHSKIGAMLLSQLPELQEIVPLVKYHHEHYDGNGYPEGLSGDSLPLESRIITVADAVDVMRNGRCYNKSRKSIREIVAEVERCAGNHFDPVCAMAFIRMIEADKISKASVSADELAVLNRPLRDLLAARIWARHDSCSYPVAQPVLVS